MTIEDKKDLWRKLSQECRDIRITLDAVQTKANIILREIVEEEQGLNASVVLSYKGKRYIYAGLERFIEIGQVPWVWGRLIRKNGSKSDFKTRLFTHWRIEK